MLNPPSIHHGQFAIERTYSATAERVYAAWGELGARASWFIGPEGWSEVRRELDFRVGGHELLEGRFGNGRVTLYTAHFHALVPASRIVLDYDMHLTGQHHSTSLATIELFPTSNDGTRLLFTEHVAFLDGTESASSREHGTGVLLDKLATYLVLPPR
jgi:uncharacterized protein YndB with AHSA1/START domain